MQLKSGRAALKDYMCKFGGTGVVPAPSSLGTYQVVIKPIKEQGSRIKRPPIATNVPKINAMRGSKKFPMWILKDNFVYQGVIGSYYYLFFFLVIYYTSFLCLNFPRGGGVQNNPIPLPSLIRVYMKSTVGKNLLYKDVHISAIMQVLCVKLKGFFQLMAVSRF